MNHSWQSTVKDDVLQANLARCHLKYPASMLSLSLYVDIEELEEGGLKNIASKAWILGISDDMWPDLPVAHRL